MPPTENVNGVDYSIVSELAKNYRMLLDPPEVEYPTREVVQRSEASGLPDGTDYDERMAAPMGETLDKAIARMSREANSAWKEWVEDSGEPKLSMTGEIEASLDMPIEEAMLSETQILDLTRIKRLMMVEKITFKRTQEETIGRLLHECSGLVDETPCGVPKNRFYEKVEYAEGSFGSRKKTVTRVDRCEGKPKTTKTEGIQISEVAQARFSTSQKERLDLMTMTAFQTEKWRKPSRSEEDKYLPNIGRLDDPDYITPLDMSSRNFSIYPPASRPYDITFKLTYLDGRSVKLVPKNKNGKDYTALSSIEYMLQQKEVKYKSIELDEVVQQTRNGLRSYPNCKFEVDIRVTYGKDLVPNPNSYKKIDPSTKLGKKLLQLLNEQPYLFSEHVWEHDEPDEKGNLRVVKKFAVGYEVTNTKDTIGPRVYWIYLDEKANLTGIPASQRSDSGVPKLARSIAPQYTYVPMRFYKQSDPNYLKTEQDFLASVRVTKNFSHYDRKAKRHINFAEVEESFITFLSSKGYILYSIAPESEYNSVLVYKFIHKDTKTREQRKKLFQKLTNHEQS